MLADANHALARSLDAKRTDSIDQGRDAVESAHLVSESGEEVSTVRGRSALPDVKRTSSLTSELGTAPSRAKEREEPFHNGIGPV